MDAGDGRENIHCIHWWRESLYGSSVFTREQEAEGTLGSIGESEDLRKGRRRLLQSSG